MSIEKSTVWLTQAEGHAVVRRAQAPSTEAPLSESPNLKQLLRQAAALGPGFRGHTENGDQGSRDALAKAITELGHEPPPYLTNPVAWNHRDAKLFEAGDYPDKGLTVTPDQMASWVSAFDLPVPIWIEHGKHPLELGYVTAVRVEGSDLKGTVALTPEANALVDKSKAHRLSIGLSPELDSIREVSLVRNPRVPGARLFCKDTVAMPGCAWTDSVQDRLNEYELRETRRKIENFLKEGRLVPAQASAATALLRCQEPVVFDNAHVPVATLVESLLQNATPHTLFGETAPGSAGEDNRLDPSHEQYFRRHFPGLNLEEIAKRLRPTR